MAIEIGIFFEKENLQVLINSLNELPEDLRPIYYGNNENIKDKKRKVSDQTIFKKFILDNPSGFFLFSEHCKYNLFIHEKSYSRLFCEVQETENYSYVPAIFQVLVKANPIFGFGTELAEREPDSNGSYVTTHEQSLSEREHRNKHFATFGINNVESGIGDDVSKYIPGLYWYTLLSDSILDKHSVKLSELSREAISCEALGDSSTYLLNFFEKPKDWRKNSDRLDNICKNINGIFFRTSAEEAVKNVNNLIEYLSIISDWR